MNVVQETEVSLVQRPDHCWQVMLSYDDGEHFLSRRIFATEEEAKQFALTWALANHNPEGKAN